MSKVAISGQTVPDLQYANPYALFNLLGQPCVPHTWYSDSSFGVVHDDPYRHSQASDGNHCTNVGTSRALIDSGYGSGSVNYFFSGRSCGFPNN